MLSGTKQTVWWILATAAFGLSCSAEAQAKKPPKPPGGSGSTETSYAIVKLDDANGTWESLAQDVNNLGIVVGYVTDDWSSSERHAAYWEVSGAGGDVQSQLSLLTAGTGALGINDAGEIVGYGNDPNGRNLGLYWASGEATPLLLPSLNENAHTSARAISNDGVVCGRSDGQAVAWRVNWSGGEPNVWGPLPLPTLDEKSTATAISNNDEAGFARIVGMFRAANNQSTAAVAWTVQSLPDGILTVDLLPRIVEAGEVDALGVNDNGTICGEADWTQAIVWTESGSQTLNLAKKLVHANARDINSSGVIVGWGSAGVIMDNQAAVWPSADGSMVLLSEYLPRKSPPFDFLKEAAAVNELGEIVGVGWNESSYGAFLAIPR